jgi:primosomal protein N' (replication factor Y) (superfamily II helicase)
MLADVVLPGRRFQVFTYQVPPHLLSRLHVGSPVMVPLGSTVVSGVVISMFAPQTEIPLQIPFRHTPLRAILSLEADAGHPPLEQNLLRLIERISDYYLAPLPACLRLIVPPHSVKVVRRVFLTEEGRVALSDKALPLDVRLMLRKLERAPNGLLRSSLSRTMKDIPAILARGKKKGWITVRTTIPSRSHDPSPASPTGSGRKPVLPVSPGLFDLPDEKHTDWRESAQRTWRYSPEENPMWDHILCAVQAGGFQEVPVVRPESSQQNLLNRTLETICHQGRRAVILVPEVHQAETFGEQLRRIGKDRKRQIEVYHGHLSSTVRSARWERIRQGNVQVVVGTRSALFLPIPNLGLIWINREDDPSYKDEHFPYYHARDVARMRGECEQTLVVYGSTRPSLEMYGQFREQVSNALEHSRQEVPHVEMIDLRSLPYATIVSPVLLTKMTRALDEGEQVILLLNRKGFSGALICRDCGLAPMCSTCGVPLKLYRRPSRLVCGYCEGIRQTPEACPTCQGTVFRFSGTGTQRLEEEVIRLFPSVSVARFDRENVKTTEEADAILQQFRQKAIRVLIGTEFLVHQSDPPMAKIIGLPQADLGLHIPDFRSAERTFQMLSKALALARNGQIPAEVIIQTSLPDHHVLKAIGQHRPRVFYDQELELREALGYPPATHVILLVVTGAQASRVQEVVDFLGQRLSGIEVKGEPHKNGKGILGTPMVLGPIASKKPGRLKKNRVLFLIKTHDLQETQRCLRDIQREYEAKFSMVSVVFEVNVDPIDIQ